MTEQQQYVCTRCARSCASEGEAAGCAEADLRADILRQNPPPPPPNDGASR